MCILAVAKKEYTKKELALHLKKHHSDQVQTDIELVPQPVEAVPLYDDFPPYSLIQDRNFSRRDNETQDTGIALGHLDDEIEDEESGCGAYQEAWGWPWAEPSMCYLCHP